MKIGLIFWRCGLMATRKFIADVECVIEFFGLNADEYESFKILCRGNMDAAERFCDLIAMRLRSDPRFGITDRIRKSLENEKQERKKDI